MKLPIENFVKWIAAFTLIAIIVCNLYVYGYFSYFGIEIYTFVSAKEILTNFGQYLGLMALRLLTYLLIFSILLCVPVLLAFLFFQGNLKKPQHGTTMRRVVWLNKNLPLFIIIIIFFFVAYMVYFTKTFPFEGDIYAGKSWNTIGIALCFELIIVASYYKIRLSLRKNPSLIQLTKFVLTLSSIFIICTIIKHLGAIDADMHSKTKLSWNYEFQFKDTTISTNDSVLRIASTDDYMFFYVQQHKKKQVLIYHKEDLIKTIQTKK